MERVVSWPAVCTATGARHFAEAIPRYGSDQQIVDSDVPEDPCLSNQLERYFPPELVSRYGRFD
jgi:hypothetical protein